MRLDALPLAALATSPVSIPHVSIVHQPPETGPQLVSIKGGLHFPLTSAVLSGWKVLEALVGNLTGAPDIGYLWTMPRWQWHQ